MGIYAEPSIDKREWFEKHAEAAEWPRFDGETLPVAYIDNGLFKAVAVLWNKREYERVAGGRPDAVIRPIAKSVLRGVSVEYNVSIDQAKAMHALARMGILLAITSEGNAKVSKTASTCILLLIEGVANGNEALANQLVWVYKVCLNDLMMQSGLKH